MSVGGGWWCNSAICLQQQKLSKLTRFCVLCCHVNPNLRVTPSKLRGSGGGDVTCTDLAYMSCKLKVGLEAEEVLKIHYLMKAGFL